MTEVSRRRRLESGANLDVVHGTAWVEGSVPKAVTGVNFPTSDVATVLSVASGWLTEAAEFVTLDEPPKVNRLDLVRDFDVAGGGLSPAEVLASVGAVPVTLRAVKAHYRDPSESQAQTVMVRTKRAGAGRLYDKQAESKVEAAQGFVRFEAQERVRSLRRGGVLYLSDLGSADVVPMARKRFEWCGFDRQFSLAAGLMARVWEDRALTEGQRLQLIGFYALGNAGVGVTVERTRLYRLRRMAEGFGYPAESEFRLDWEHGLVAA